MVGVRLSADHEVYRPIPEGKPLAQFQIDSLRVRTAINEDLLASGRLNQDGISLSDIEKAYMKLVIRHGQSHRPHEDSCYQEGKDKPFWRKAEARPRNDLTNFLHS